MFRCTLSELKSTPRKAIETSYATLAGTPECGISYGAAVQILIRDTDVTSLIQRGFQPRVTSLWQSEAALTASLSLAILVV